MKLRIRSLGVWSVVKTVFLMSWATNFVIWLLILLIIFIIGSALTGLVGQVGDYDSDGAGFFSRSFTVIVMAVPIATGFAFLQTLIVALGIAIYNFVAPQIGGIELDAEQLEPTRSKTALVHKKPVVKPHTKGSDEG